MPDISLYEKPLWDQGCTNIAGADEAGRGPIAGPVVAACVIMPPDRIIEGINDSKKLSEKRREALYEQITETAAAMGVGICEADEVEALGILPATREALMRALTKMGTGPDHLFTDYMELDVPYPLTSMAKADQKIYTVAAASIVAKVTRDRMMREYDSVYPGYGFARHKGYGTPQHRRALEELGPCQIHRASFVRTFLARPR